MMSEKLISDFAHALRGEGVQVSPAEVLDAVHVIDLCGIEDRTRLREGLAMAMTKTLPEKRAFYRCFDQFFEFQAPSREPGQTAVDAQADAVNPAALPASGASASAGQGGGRGHASGAAPGTPALAQTLMQQDHAALAMSMAQAAEQVGLSSMRVITQRGLFTRRMLVRMGVEPLDAYIRQLEQGDRGDRQQAQALARQRERLREDVSAYVQKQLLLHARKTQRALREKHVRGARLADLTERDDARQLMRKMAKKLVAVHARKKRKARRGLLDLRKTLTAGVRFDGVPFDLHWKKTRREREKILVICDVSGSVSVAARFLLLFLYAVSDVLPRVRAFAFSSRCGEVTSLFQTLDADQAAEEVLARWGGSGTDYGAMLQWFWHNMEPELNKKTTVIILGDARNNDLPAQQTYLSRISDKVKQVYWLNPESSSRWDAGDSIMRLYRPYCRDVRTCNSLAQLERFINLLAASAR